MTIANLINTYSLRVQDDTTWEQINTTNKIPTENYNDDSNEEIMDKQGNIIKISQELNTEQRKKALRLMNNCKHLFTSDLLEIGCAKVEPCEIKLKTVKSKFQPPYRVSPAQRHKLRILIKQMINTDIIEPSKNNYAAPVFLIPKKEKGEYRFLVDYRKLNNETIPDKHRISRSKIFLEAWKGLILLFYRHGSGIFSYSDKTRGNKINKAGFITDFGLFNFKRIPQGFKNSAPIFQRIMIAYLDDICCFGNNFEKALTNLKDIFSRLGGTGLKLKTNKCNFFSSNIELLGHSVSNTIRKKY